MYNSSLVKMPGLPINSISSDRHKRFTSLLRTWDSGSSKSKMTLHCFNLRTSREGTSLEVASATTKHHNNCIHQLMLLQKRWHPRWPSICLALHLQQFQLKVCFYIDQHHKCWKNSQAILILQKQTFCEICIILQGFSCSVTLAIDLMK